MPHKLLLWISLSHWLAPLALGCSCIITNYDGFVAESSPKLLPSNAKGVIFRLSAWSTSRNPLKEIQAGKFTLEDSTLQQKIPVTIRELQLDLTRKEHSAPAVVRVEPKGGFVAGHHYIIRFTPARKPELRGKVQAQNFSNELALQISAEKLTLPGAGGVKLTPDSGIVTQMVAVAEGGMCSGNILARVQRLSFQVDPVLEKYRASLLFFTEVHSKEEVRFWHYQSSACSSTRWGRSELETGKDLVYVSCTAKGKGGWPLNLDTPYRLRGRWAFLEMEDTQYATAEIPVTFSSTAGECDEKKFMSQTLANADPKTICQLARSEEQPTVDSIQGLVRLTSHANVEVRRCAYQALTPIPYRLQNSTDVAVLESMQKKVIPALAQGLSHTDAQVRQHAAALFGSLVHIWGRPSDSRRVLDFAATFGKVEPALNDDEHRTRVTLGEALEGIGPKAKATAPALRAAIANTAKPNYAAPPALASVDPENPETVQALIAALKHPDSIVRGTVARGLGMTKVETPKVVSALVEAVRADNSSEGIEALGKLGPAAKEATALLLEVATTAKWAHLRENSFKALVQIGENKPAVRAALVENLKHPIGEYTRVKALEALGEMGADALPAVEAMRAILKQKPTQWEMGNLVRAWKKMNPPAGEIKASLREIAKRDDGYVRQEAQEYLKHLP